MTPHATLLPPASHPPSPPTHSCMRHHVVLAAAPTPALPHRNPATHPHALHRHHRRRRLHAATYAVAAGTALEGAAGVRRNTCDGASMPRGLAGVVTADGAGVAAAGTATAVGVTAAAARIRAGAAIAAGAAATAGAGSELPRTRAGAITAAGTATATGAGEEGTTGAGTTAGATAGATGATTGLAAACDGGGGVRAALANSCAIEIDSRGAPAGGAAGGDGAGDDVAAGPKMTAIRLVSPRGAPPPPPPP